MIRFRPLLGPTLFTVPAVLLMLGLAVWQVQRLHWKTALIAERTERIQADPVAALPIAAADVAAAEYRRIRLTGSFLNDHELYLAARSLRGAPGYHVVTPLRLADGTTVMVDRGWVPMERKDPASRAAGQLAGTVTLDGVIRRPLGQNWMVPDNQPARNIWFWIDLPAMARAAGIDGPVAPVLVEAGPAANPGGLPIGGQTRVELPNDHLQYALTWFALAIGLACVYLVFHHQRGRLVVRR
ncbi:MAG: SURF1 family protein [Dongiaceae bacterium]